MAKTPTHGHKPPAIPQPPKVLSAGKNGGYKLHTGAIPDPSTYGANSIYNMFYTKGTKQ